MRLKAVTGYEYSGTFYKQPPLMSGLGGHLREVVAYGKLIAIWLTEELIGILVRWSLNLRGGRLRERWSLKRGGPLGTSIVVLIDLTFAY